MTIRLAIAGTLIFACTAPKAMASWSLEVDAQSDVVRRAIALTDGEPAIGARLDWDSRAGAFAGVSGYYAGGTPSGDALTRGLRAYGGWFFELADDRALELSFAHTRFPGVDNWDYSELRADYHLSPELGLTLAWSPDYFSRGATHTLLGGTWQPALGRSFYLSLAGGVGRLGGAFDETLWFGTVGVGFAAGRVDVRLSYSRLDDVSARVFLTERETIALRIGYLVF